MSHSGTDAQAARPHADPETFLTGSKPHQVQFPNHRSTQDHTDFVTAQINKCLTAGAVRPWPSDQPPPTVINGLRVVPGTAGKKDRLCMNPMYPNLFMEIPALKYERVTDVAHYLQPTDFMFTTDDKSGYWNLLLHPSMYEYAAFEWHGKIYFWPALAFGFAPACWVYTTLKQELLRPLRERGINLSFLIDDLCPAAKSRETARRLCLAIVQLLTALGFTLSLDKMQLPSQRVRFLGFIIDAAKQAFEVPKDKVEALR